ncbi:DNA mismatch repair protein MutS [Desnuesiella massiliensis]|uniref:DNA mismatch repair protein MutS n=1 Tax=Desnuesiella massiliensis TaxID=1650662 RepID=UPI0006E382C2|nr:DNA mismatch repair protein MutS [Desnuesiella massiliensis]
MAITPMMQQYLQIKEDYKDCIVFFRLGDFYEMFFEDAEVASKELELVLTGRDCGLEDRAPMCGIPYHASNSYVGKLISRGYKVAICEQVEDPALAKGIVKRDVIKVITPGTFNDSNFIDESKNNYIMSIFVEDINERITISFADIATGEFYSTKVSRFDYVIDEISKFYPKEILIQQSFSEAVKNRIINSISSSITIKNDNYFKDEYIHNIEAQFKNFETSNYDNDILFSINALLKYIIETQKLSLSNIEHVEVYNISETMSIDINTRRNLELTETLRDKSKKGSLLWVLDKTNTSMGSRLLRKWVEQPLLVKERIEERLSAVEELTNNLPLKENLVECLKSIYDIERITGKISAKSVNAKELISLKNSIGKIPNVKQILKEAESSYLRKIHSNLDELKDIFSLLESSILDNPSLGLKEGNIIKDGYNEEIDELKRAKTNGKQWIANLESREREVTGIKSLKVGYNKVFGYYIEISRANYDLIPEGRYIRKQTLANAERFITEELKNMEDKILGAEDKLINLEYNLFVYIRDLIEKQVSRMKLSAKLLSEVDCVVSLASVALDNNYVRPLINEKNYISITEGRHPVVEKVIPTGSFISNDTFINNSKDQMLIITGPNMAGKSTYMRQVALITLMGQIGSFVPAAKADLCVLDKIFTRIGASDDLSAGKSTFMVEMCEVANILKNATQKSLVLLDEVGRGTSTYDGLSIAWAVIEHICNNKALKCKTLFATHYHELTDLESKIEGIKNYSVAVKEVNNSIVFLRKIIPGGADQSYGIEVAKLAGLPENLIKRAKEILETLEMQNALTINTKTEKDSKDTKQKQSSHIQMGFEDFAFNSFVKEVSEIDILNINPIQALNKLYEVINKAKGLL